MSEDLSRRTVLAGGLAVLVDKLLPGTAWAQEANAKQADAHQELISALKDYLFASYDVVLKKNQAIPEEKRTRFSKALTAAGLEKTLIEQMDAKKDPAALKEYFKARDLAFDRIAAGGTMLGYTLQKHSAPEQRTIKLFDKQVNTSVKTVTEDIIPDILDYAQIQNPDKNIPEISGICHLDSNDIILMPHKYRRTGEAFHDQYHEKKKQIQEEIKNPEFLDQFIKKSYLDTKKTTLTPEFFSKLGTHLRASEYADIFERNVPRDERISKFASDMMEDIFWHEAMHAADNNKDWAFMNDFSERKQQECKQNRAYHQELRAELSSLVHGHSRRVLAEVIKRLGIPPPFKNAPHWTASGKILEAFTLSIKKNQKDYSSLDFSKNEDYEIIKQFTKLTNEQVKTLAIKTYESMYKGKTLREYLEELWK